jgi:hypothetical protein
MRRFNFMFVALVVAIYVGSVPAMAQTIIDTFGPGASTTKGWRGTAQTITAPPDNVLMDY